MFFNKNHPHHVGVPDNFPKKSPHSKAMLFLTMGITTQQLGELNNNILDDRGLWNLVNDIADRVKAKRSSLELNYGARDRNEVDKMGRSITRLGRWLKKLKEAMVSALGSKKKANAKIDDHTGMFGTNGELHQQKLENYFG